MIGVISDVRFPRKGTKYSEAGLDFAKWAREIDPSIPILLQSTQKENEKNHSPTRNSTLNTLSARGIFEGQQNHTSYISDIPGIVANREGML